jgi:superfamily II DNA or RNA helicase
MLVKEIQFQKDAVISTINAYKENPKARIMLVSPTGTGKTIIARLLLTNPELHATLIRNPNRKTFRVIYKCHMERLLTQARRRFPDNVVESSLENWMNPDYESDNEIEIVYQMLSKKIDKNLDADLIVYDECHHEACNTVQKFLENAGHLPSFGMTATNERGDNCLIKFDKIIRPISREDAVAQGYICATDLRTIVDTSKNKVELGKQILKEFHHEMGQTMVFVRTKKEIDEITQYIVNELNLTAIAINDECDVDLSLDEFGNGKYKFCVSARRCGEGVDCPGVTDVIFIRNVGSLTDLNQYIGRAARIDVNKCQVWQFVNPLSSNNLDACDVVGIPKSHHLISRKNGKFEVRDFL